MNISQGSVATRLRYGEVLVIAFRVRRSRSQMYIGHGRLRLHACLSLSAFPHYCTDPDVTWENGSGCPLIVHYWADLESVHGLRCYGNMAQTVPCHGANRYL